MRYPQVIDGRDRLAGDLHDPLLRVRIVEPGGGRLRIAPRTGGLPYVQGHTNTPNGEVWVSWEPQEWSLEVTVPEGTTAKVVLPTSSPANGFG